MWYTNEIRANEYNNCCMLEKKLLQTQDNKKTDDLLSP